MNLDEIIETVSRRLVDGLLYFEKKIHLIQIHRFKILDPTQAEILKLS